ncbi:hypothetical protein [Actinoplanes missouriensis]|uniref:hypothetical protein n=1 Tax=Actinoplanes missouriensis TaxID=1866 RepID=UPI00059EDE71|nr:hypothetical protein [Actinoplanes missouriensis]
MTDKQLADALRSFKRAESVLDERRQELFKAIGRAIVENGERQAAVVEQTGYTREHVRRICAAYVRWKSGETTTLKIAR